MTPIPTIPGTPFEGGFYAGRLRGDAGATIVLIVAPNADGETKGPWQDSSTDVQGAGSFFDSEANTNAMALAEAPLALWAKNLQIGGFVDWYLPSRDELEVLYRAFKPTDDKNYVWRNGDNPSSLPPGYPYTVQTPAQTEISAFKAGGAEAFEAEWYWSSTQCSRHSAWGQVFDDGYQNGYGGKSFEARARAVRRLIIQP